ncbi:isochorismatase domain-containing protein 1 isoform X3 [Sceloporus undulatus]|uniref:isochorismatase domain-containing protein 1 isoform X3 n=1 Tax=Sceloporus undulatus TaxID=8520 RepID=UPI001C4CAC1E|nr:isochorismatase domain-containing protein 1 isoform X3 [Sceloporus undulatus]
MVRRRSRSRDWGPPLCNSGSGRRRSCFGEVEQRLLLLPLNMAAAAAGETEAPSSSSSSSVPVLFCFSVFARPSSVPRGSGYEALIQKFLSLYGDQLDMHRKFVVQLFSEEWSQYVDLPKGFLVAERCKVRLVPLQIQITTLGNLTPSSTVFFCCDMQERFRPAIKYFGDIISVGQRLTHVCIQQTALELIGRGLEVHIVADATSSRSMMDRMFALERLARTGIIVTTSEAILLQLIADKDHPKFKEIQNLIKYIEGMGRLWIQVFPSPRFLFSMIRA